jgi:ABC-type transporter Mla subunit MlaD
MSAIDDLVGTLQSVINELDDARSTGGSAKSEAEEVQLRAAAVPAHAVVAGLEVVKDDLDRLMQQISAAIDSANDAITHAKAAADGS